MIPKFKPPELEIPNSLIDKHNEDHMTADEILKDL